MNLLKAFVVLIIFATVPAWAQIRNAGKVIVSEENIFPLQPEHVHGSSMVVLPNDDILACWFQGSGERTADDVRIMGARLKTGSKIWSEPFLMADTKGLPDCNPVLFLNRNGKLFLFWIAVIANNWENSLLRFRTSTHYTGNAAPEWEWQDDLLLKPGETFTAEVEKQFKSMPRSNAGWSAYAPPYDNMIVAASRDVLKRSLGWMTRIHPLVLAGGRILLPLYSDGFNFSMVAISDDEGETWRPGLPIVGRGPIQPALAQKKNGTIVAYMRDSGDAPSRVQISTSTDNGESWSFSEKTEIPNEASVEICVLRDGRWAFFGNELDDGRYQLSLRISEDEGSSWHWKELIEYDPGKKGSFSYPCLVQSKEGLLHITYSYAPAGGLKTIKHVVIDPQRIPRQKN